MGTPSQAPASQPTYAYSPNPPYHPAPPNAVMQRPPQQQQGFAVQPPQYYSNYPGPTQQQMVVAQQAYLQEQRRQSSLPPQFMHQVHPGAQQHIGQPQHYPQNQAQPTSQPDQNTFQSPPLPQPRPLPAHARSHSIFTPIDDSRSLLAQHWGGSSSHYREPIIKTEVPRSHSVDDSLVPRQRLGGTPPRPSETTAPPQATCNPTMQAPPPGPPQRNASVSSMPGPIRPSGGGGEAKRPRLKVQIPSEQSDAGSDDGGTASATPLRVGQGVVLPPPSPSTNALLSAGASGPPNPFARPAPPVGTNAHVNRERDHIETPLSALPSRVMDGNQLLPSPSSFWPDAWFGRDNNMMPSPLNFQTPVVMNGPGFRDEDERKRKAEEETGGGSGKRPKE
jgi:MADS-box transcription factor